jgi:hypothetical protein
VIAFGRKAYGSVQSECVCVCVCVCVWVVLDVMGWVILMPWQRDAVLYSAK